MLNKYESIYIVNPNVEAEGIKSLVEKFNALIESEGGKVLETNEWGMKKLAYPIDFKKEGFYVLMNITLNPLEVDAMAKLMNITEGIVRQLFVRKDA